MKTQTQCTWSPSTAASWITGLTPAAGKGDGQIEFHVEANPEPTVRQAEISVNGERVSIVQEAAPCRFSFSPTGQTVDAGGGNGSVLVTTTGGCSWKASSSAPWITIASGADGDGTGSINFQIALNSGAARSGALKIAGFTFTVNQAGVCSYSLSRNHDTFTAAGGIGASIAVSGPGTCGWSAVIDVPWISVASGGNGTGNGTVALSIAPNTGVSRNAAIAIAGQVFTVTQAGACVSSIDPASQSMPNSGGSGAPVTISTAASCSWTAASNSGWITITSGANGSGNGTLTFSVAANAGAARTGTLSIAGNTFTLTQQASCSYSIDPTNQSIDAGGGGGHSIDVATTSGCAWTGSSNAPWITITSGATGSGSGGLVFSVAANPGTDRTGTITVAGRTFTVTQAGGCSASINPTTQSFGNAGGAGATVNVSAGAGCTWAATSNDAWITITSGTSGRGNGAVTFSVASNASAARTGTMNIAGTTFTVTQDGVCSYTINPTGQSINATGGAGVSISVSTQAGCAWTTTSNDAWLTITTGASGSGNGSVAFTVATNSGSARTGTLTIAGRTFTVTQAARSPLCLALDYPGASGGERIQNALNDSTCTTVTIDRVGPDTSGTWQVPRPINLRSNVTIQSGGGSNATLTAIPGDGWNVDFAGLLTIVGQSNITIRGVNVQSSKLARRGIDIMGSHNVTILQGTVAGAVKIGIRIPGGAPSSDITISEMTFLDNGDISVRTDNTQTNVYNSHVVVRNNTMSGALYGVAFQNCSSASAPCEIRDNVIRALAASNGSGMDLNRSHYAIVSGNNVASCGHGMTVDDTQNARISQNTFQGCLGFGIVLGNGARPQNRPWVTSGNQITNNTISNNGYWGLASYRSTDPADLTQNNTWSNNRIEGNLLGGCQTTADHDVFSSNGPQPCQPQTMTLSPLSHQGSIPVWRPHGPPE